MAWIFSTFKFIVLKLPKFKTWQIMCGYFIVAKTRFSCKCYTYGQKMNMYMLIVYIIHGSFGDIMLNHDL
jgi:hypothetical protein